MCRWLGLHFHGWIDYNGVAFPLELLEWDRIFSGFGTLENSGRYGFKNEKIFTSLSLTNGFGSAVIGFSCCGVPAQIFKLLLVYCYVLITSVCISSVFFFSCILQGKANKIK